MKLCLYSLIVQLLVGLSWVISCNGGVNSSLYFKLQTGGPSGFLVFMSNLLGMPYLERVTLCWVMCMLVYISIVYLLAKYEIHRIWVISFSVLWIVLGYISVNMHTVL